MQYQYNTDMTPTRTQLQNLSQKWDDSFKEYAQRWREMAVKVQPPMLEREMVEMFSSTLQGQYYTTCSTSGTFVEMVTHRERIEIRIKLGKIQDVVARSNAGNTKKSFGGHQNKKEGESSMVYS